MGVPAALVGMVLTFALVNWTGRVGNWTMLPGGIGIIVLATGLYRLTVGFVPIIARTRLLRMLVMLRQRPGAAQPEIDVREVDAAKAG